MRRAIILILAAQLWRTTAGAVSGADQPFPAIPGWNLREGEKVYTRTNLYDLIDGAADQFLSYGFTDLRTAEYADKNGVDVRVELYRHDSPTNAFGMYTAERSPEYHFTEVGTQGYIEDGVLNFLSGNFYVKITTQATGEIGRGAMSLVAERVNAALKQGKSWPRTLTLLPEKGRRMNSEGYIAENFLGYSFLHSAFFADYTQPGQYRLFVIELEKAADARTMAGKYLEYSNHDSTAPGERTYQVSDPNNGPVAIGLRGRCLFGVVNCQSDSLRGKIIEELGKAFHTREPGSLSP